MSDRFPHVDRVCTLRQPAGDPTMSKIVLPKIGRQRGPLRSGLEAATDRWDPFAGDRRTLAAFASLGSMLPEPVPGG